MTPPMRIGRGPATLVTESAHRDTAGADGASRLSTDTRTPVRIRATWLELVVLAGIAAWVPIFSFLRWPALVSLQFNSNSNIDSAFFAYAGQLVRTGGVPYVTFWDHKPPLIYLIDAAVLAVSGGGVRGLWLVNVAALLVTLGCSYVAWRRLFGAAPAVVGSAALVFSLALVAPFNLTEGYALPIQAATMLLLSYWATTRDRVVRPAVALGILAGLAFLLRPNLVVAPAVAAFVMLLALLALRHFQAVVQLLGGVVAGAALTIAPVILWLVSAGAFDAFVDQVYRYNMVYSATSWGARLRAAFDGIAISTMYATLLLPAAGWLVAAFRLRTTRATAAKVPVLCFALLWFPMEVIAAAVPGRPYMHYFAMLLVPLAMLVSLAVFEAIALAGRVDTHRGQAWRRIIVVALCALIAVVPVGRAVIERRDSGLRGERAEQVDAAAQFLRANTSSSDHVLVWGHAADVYLFSEREPASRFVYPLPLLTPGYADSALVAGFLDELRATQPVLLIDATRNVSRSEALIPSLGTWQPDWQYPEEGLAWWTMTPALRAFYDYVAANYTPGEQVGPQRWLAYRRVSAPTR